MQQILAFTRKELQLWAQKPGSWVLVFVLPLIFIWIMQAVFGSGGTPVVTVYAVDEDKTPQSEEVMEALRNAMNVEIEELATREEASQRVSAGRRMAAVIVPNGFSQDVGLPGGADIEIIIDPARAEQASIATGLVNAALSRVIIDAEVTRGVEDGIKAVMSSLPAGTIPDSAPTPPANQGVRRTDQGPAAQGTGTPEPDALAPRAQVTAEPDPLEKFFVAALKGVVSSQVEEALANPQVTMNAQPFQEEDKEGARQPSLLDYLVPGYSLMFVFFLISNIASTVIEERQAGTLRRLLVAPVPRSRILLGKMIPYFLIAVVQFTFILLASRVIFGINLGGSVLALAIIILAASLALVSLGILIAAFARSEGQASGLAIVLVLAMAVVSGAMFPNISIPGMKAITPHYWALQGFVNTIARGQGVQGVLLPAGILLTMAAVFFTIGAVRFRFE